MFFPIKDENYTRSVPIVTLSLIGLNILVFIYQYFIGPLGFETYVKSYGFVPYRLFHASSSAIINLEARSKFSEIYNILTSMFMHGGFSHIIMNMWILYIFGDNVEDSLGKFKFILFYLLCGVVATLSHSIVHAGSEMPLVGASGAIAGVMGAYMILFPRARVVSIFIFIILIRIIKVPALLWIGFWLFLQIIYSPLGGPVAYLAHIGGFIAGVVLLFLLGSRKKGFRILSVK